MSAIQKTFWLLSAVVLVCSGVSCGSSKVKLNGQGATFPEPLYNKWCQEYAKTHKGVQINYQGVGSGEGIKGVIDHTVDFGASDVGMKPEEMEKVEGGVQLLPMTAGSIVVAYNVEGVKELNLTRKAYAGIFQGAITKWDDDEIKKPTLALRCLPQGSRLWYAPRRAGRQGFSPSISAPSATTSRRLSAKGKR